MDAAFRIAEIFERLCRLRPKDVAALPMSEQVVFYVVMTRCEKDTNGLEAVFEQLFDAEGIHTLGECLRILNESELADEFCRLNELLKAEGFYEHRDSRLLPKSVKSEIAAVQDVVGDRLWDLDEKLVGLFIRSC